VSARKENYHERRSRRTARLTEPEIYFVCSGYSATAPSSSRQCHDPLLRQTHSKGTATLMTGMGTAVVAVTQLAPDAAQTWNRATAPGTGEEESRSKTRGDEHIATTTDEGGTTMRMNTTGGEVGEGAVTTVMMMAEGGGTKAGIADTRADMTMAWTRMSVPRGPRGMSNSTAIKIEATVRETTMNATAVTVATTSAGTLYGAALHLLDAPVLILIPVRIPAPATSRARRHPLRRRRRTKGSPTLPSRACSLQRRTRSRIRTERARCSSITNLPRLANPSSGGGCTFSRATNKSVRPFCLPIYPVLASNMPIRCLFGASHYRSTPYPSPKCVPHRS
jgi:hypothetical protein